MRELAEVLQDWEAVIGLEIHTELTALETKMFCGCKLSHEDEPNEHVCPVCLGLPGALPVPNRRAIQGIVKAGLACGCRIQRRSMFYRKHYFYPDMAKNFQTTQGPVAFCMHGGLTIEVTGPGAAERPESAFGDSQAASAASAQAGAQGLSMQMAAGLPEGEDAGAIVGATPFDASSAGVPTRLDAGGYQVPIRILRIHMEEDAAKMTHVGGAEGRITEAQESLIDYNRCGTPLIELVTEPDLRTPEEARLFMEKLRRIFLTLGISDCSMEHGSMRCDGNVSLRRRGDTALGTKTELKNLNSFKSLHDGLAYEIRRQAEVLESGGTIRQETRHWEPGRKRTVAMRAKETADDYRLFPDPDLAPFVLDEAFVDACAAEIPELPDAKRDRFIARFGIKRADAEQIAGDPEVSAFFEAAAEAGSTEAQTVANLVVNELAGYLKAAGTSLAASGIKPSQVASLAHLLATDAISSNQAHEVFELMAKEGRDPEAIVDERGMRQVSDAGALQGFVDDVIAAFPDQVQQVREGNGKVIGFLVGQCMKASKGTGNPKRFNELLREALL
ncbi:Asp-tRNA(Asn)/Glu-tRNA(Gln) amidotransferase subunit GatB [Collinsella sp. AGMB00827]|uniref:Aspartyl/glutamyl-tRNA(Asn/Gln) amidotransferase subunit B n=1 Tax=Collinsella ureilytica TaxID=2869515 RepID=A0ABS7MIX0_9ACTN|nr:Asp-tRNA(Asn)/Glu-tRNA(Gln) amidotransferase subunit GatB [Collinsella urealyticum]MBY4797299.1 Asp-tRNA(Asn)/Glu-tRNA(Gln) amidotransferase subunit GatB [Collinsella urealyticum]